MIDATARIKNLSIALEALSRSGISLRLCQLHTRIEDLLSDVIKEEETKTATKTPARPAIFSPLDDIPF